MIHQAVNVTTTEAKLFTIKYGITNINHIVVITDFLYAAKRIFDSLLHHIKFILPQFLVNSETFS